MPSHATQDRLALLFEAATYRTCDRILEYIHSPRLQSQTQRLLELAVVDASFHHTIDDLHQSTVDIDALVGFIETFALILDVQIDAFRCNKNGERGRGLVFQLRAKVRHTHTFQSRILAYNGLHVFGSIVHVEQVSGTKREVNGIVKRTQMVVHLTGDQCG